MDVKEQLRNDIGACEWYSIQFDELTNVGAVAQVCFHEDGFQRCV